jgi:hypothetical protein
MPFTVKINSFQHKANFRLRTRSRPATGDRPPCAPDRTIEP